MELNHHSQYWSSFTLFSSLLLEVSIVWLWPITPQSLLWYHVTQKHSKPGDIRPTYTHYAITELCRRGSDYFQLLVLINGRFGEVSDHNQLWFSARSYWVIHTRISILSSIHIHSFSFTNELQIASPWIYSLNNTETQRKNVARGNCFW